MVVAPSAMATSTHWQRNSSPVRLASSALHSTSSVKAFARRTLSRIRSTRLLAGHPELRLEVQVGGGEEDMDPAAGGVPDRLAGQVDVPLGAARQGGDHRPAHLGGDLLHAAEVGLG